MKKLTVIRSKDNNRSKAAENVQDLRAPVPSGYCIAVTRHKVPVIESLFEYVRDEYDDVVKKPISPKLIEDYENRFTGQELELINAALFRCQKGDGRADFKSKYEWAKLATGGKQRDLPDMYLSMQSVQTPHQLLIKEKKEYILSKTPPINTEEIKDADGRKKYIVRVAETIYRNPSQSYYYLPLAISEIYRRGGIDRVRTHHIKLYFYLYRMVTNARGNSTINLNFDPIYEACGIAHYCKNNNGHRRPKIIRSSFEALRKAGVLVAYEYTSQTSARVTFEESHFRFITINNYRMAK